MLRKIISIKNVGRFLNSSASGNLELKRYSLIFAENGRGKTTLCAILRSLQSGEAAYIIGRTTLGAVDAPEVRVLLDNYTATFCKGMWNITIPDLAIFDSTFVSENVYSGDSVDLEHKRNLYRIIIGKQGVELARQIDMLDAASRAKSTDIREKLTAVQVLVPQDLTVETFLTLKEDPEIDIKISKIERELQAVKEADQIKNRTALSELPFPMLPAKFETLLTRTIGSIAIDVQKRVATQIEAHAMHDHGENWLSEGLGYVRDNTCPFCGQSLDDATILVDAYKAYFSETYNDLQIEIATLRQEVENILGERQIAEIERLIDQNSNAVEFWSRYCDITSPALIEVQGTPGELLRTFRETALALLDRKAINPLDRVSPDEAFTTTKAALDEMQTRITSYNQVVLTTNATITAKKTITAAADVKKVESALSLLHATKKRHELHAKEVCQAYKSALKEKKSLEDQKEDIRSRLDEYTKQVIDPYERTINLLLDNFNAGFRITGISHGYPGGVASSSYKILINETAVDLGDGRTPLDRPSFRNTLSSGDKSTLALAFFIAQLEQDADKTEKIVVFDDPFSSQDNFRKDCTVQRIKKCGESCHQVIVLSHDQSFLKRIWDRLAPQAKDRKCIQLSRIGVRNTRFAEWDIEGVTQSCFLTDLAALAHYHNTGDANPLDIARKIRPVLETHCSNLFPGEFLGDTLGIIIGKVRTAGADHHLFPQLIDLDTINEYTCRYHHGEKPNAVTEPINEIELQGFVKKTLMITGIC